MKQHCKFLIFLKIKSKWKKMTEKWPVSSIYTNNIFIWVQVDYFFSSEKDFKVQTCTIALDFNSGKDVYSVIWEKIKDKEVGILGKWINVDCI